LADIGRALLRFSAQKADTSVHANLIIYAPQRDLCPEVMADLREIPSIIIAGSLLADQVMPELSRADVLVHVESFGAAAREYTRLSISTKIPQYMASGRAILAYGPSEVASCAYITETGAGLVVGDRNPDVLDVAIKKLTLDTQLRADLGRRGWERARSHHNSELERDRFRQTLARAASSPTPLTPKIGR
jgi:glycosyltransferase involved in cell wall biosynthesis